MTRKHFQALAEAVGQAPSWAIFSDYQLGILAQFCYNQNPRFAKDVWIAAVKMLMMYGLQQSRKNED